MFSSVFKGAPMGNKNAAGPHKTSAHADSIPRNARAEIKHQTELQSSNWHTKTMASFKDKSNASLQYIRQDAHAAAKAMPDGPKAGQYMDEVHYASMEMTSRAKHFGTVAKAEGFDLLFKAGFDESKHPRGKDGKFGSRSGSGPDSPTSTALPRRVVAQTERAAKEAVKVTDGMPPKKPPPRAADINQPGVKSVDDLFKQAMDAKPEFDAKMNQLSKLLGPDGRVMEPSGYDKTMADFDKGSNPGMVLMIGPTKKLEKVRDKVLGYADKNGIAPAAQVGDIHRATIAVDKITDIPKALSALGVAGAVFGREPKVRLVAGTGAGYRDVLTNIQLPNGHMVEVQVNTKKMLVAKEVAHTYYNQQCKIEAGAIKEGRTTKSAKGEIVAVLTPKEQVEHKRLEDLQVAIYSKAWKESGG